MIHIVAAENRHLFHAALEEMHRQRKSVFIDGLEWELSASGDLEVDGYDTPEAIYLLDISGPRVLLDASVRLLRTDRPHLLSDVFADLCPEGVPSGAHIWEATRFCPAPHLPKGQARRDKLGMMIAAIMETALLFGVDQIVFVANPALSPLALLAGWDVKALGPAVGKGCERVVAMMADISADGLRRVRDRNGVAAPVTRFTPGERRLVA